MTLSVEQEAEQLTDAIRADGWHLDRDELLESVTKALLARQQAEPKAEISQAEKDEQNERAIAIHSANRHGERWEALGYPLYWNHLTARWEDDKPPPLAAPPVAESAEQINAAPQEPLGKPPGIGGNVDHRQNSERSEPVRGVPVGAAPFCPSCDSHDKAVHPIEGRCNDSWHVSAPIAESAGTQPTFHCRRHGDYPISAADGQCPACVEERATPAHLRKEGV